MGIQTIKIAKILKDLNWFPSIFSQHIQVPASFSFKFCKAPERHQLQGDFISLEHVLGSEEIYDSYTCCQ